MSSFSLSASDERKLVKNVPLHQYNVQFSFAADIIINHSKTFPDGGVTMSEHMITLNKRSLFGGFSAIKYIHILNIDYFNFTTDNIIEIGLSDSFYGIKSTKENILRFVRYFHRNYLLINGIIPTNLKINFSIEESYNIINPGIFLSLSKMFEGLYNANCSLRNCTYCHDVVRFIHKLITQENCIADFSRMPLNLMDNTYSTAIELAPIFDTLKFFPTISGIQIKDVGRPDFFYAIAPYVRESPNLRLISLEACNVSNGCGEFGVALAENPNLHLEYLDISDNPFEDLAPIAAALSQNNGNLWYLDFSNCNMSNYAMTIAMSSLIENQNLWDIIHLDFRGATVKSDSVDLILHYLRTIDQADHHSLRFLSFGKLTTRSDEIIAALTKHTQPIETLYLNGSKFDKNGIDNLLEFISETRTLKELDLSDTNLTPTDISDVITAIAENRNIFDFEIKLNNLGLKGEHLDTVLETFSKYSNCNWTCISLDKNGMKPNDVKKLAKTFMNMRKLTGVSISCNMKKNQSGNVEAIESLLNLPNLKKLWIHGDDKHYIGPALKRVFPKVKSKGLLLFDLAFNHIKDEGLIELQRMIEGNSMLYELTIDGSHPHNIETIKGFMTQAAKSKYLRRMKFPVEDVFYLVKRQSSKEERESVFRDIAIKQNAIQDQLLRNQTLKGLHSDLSEQNIPELDEMLDEMTARCHDRLSIFNTLKHNGALLSIGLPFPNLSEFEDQEKNIQTTEPTKEMQDYGITDAAVWLNEKPDETYQMHVKAINIRKGLAMESGLAKYEPESDNDFFVAESGIMV